MRKKDQQRESFLLKSFGEVVRIRRVKLNMTQEELGNVAKLHRTYITDIESGLRNLTFLTMERIAAALDTSLAELIGEAESIDS